MDEPSEGLAPMIVEELQLAMGRLRRERSLSIILVEQNSRVALDFAERCIVMNRGRIVRDGPSEELKADRQLLDRLIGVDVA
jgi:branched-chain amino acid transport system ATP-binding protein